MPLYVIGGDLKGRKLKTPSSSITRPTMGIVRKVFFDIVQNKIKDSLFLDLFAGSGAMGIESLSRGAKHATFIEMNRDSYLCLKYNLSGLGLNSKSKAIQGEVLKTLHRMGKKNQAFDLIFADPPYQNQSIYLKLLNILQNSPLLSTESLLFIEAKNPVVPIQETGWILLDKRSIGTSSLLQYRKDAQKSLNMYT